MTAGLFDRPIVVAPMGGGPSTPDLVVAAAEAGALGFLAAAYKTADEVEAQIRDVWWRTKQPFGVNVFVPGAPTEQRDQLAAYVEELGPEADRLGVDLGTPSWNDDEWDAKCDVIVETAPAVCSFTFGCPPAPLVQALRRRGTVVMITVTNPDEADAALAIGAEVLCAQGIEAGAHRGTFVDDDARDAGLSTLDLLAAVRTRTDVPVVTAGGIAFPEDVTAALDAGAVAVQAGTAFLRCTESGVNAVHKDALVDPRFAQTAMTRSFTGRRARGLVNRFMKDHPAAPVAYPEVHNLTRPLRAAAVAQSDPDTTNLWAGVGHAHARNGSLASILDWLSGAVP